MDNEDGYEILSREEYFQKVRDIEKSLTPEFLETLRQACKYTGWSLDYTEIQDFYWHLVELSGSEEERTDSLLTPYGYRLDEEPLEDMSDKELLAEWREMAYQHQFYAIRYKKLENEINRREFARREKEDGSR